MHKAFDVKERRSIRRINFSRNCSAKFFERYDVEGKASKRRRIYVKLARVHTRKWIHHRLIQFDTVVPINRTYTHTYYIYIPHVW